LIADSAGIRVSRGVFVRQYVCSNISDEQGRFRITGIPPGFYEVTIGDIGVRHVPPVRVRVGPDSVSRVDIHLRPENLVLDCVEVSSCATIIAPIDATVAASMTAEEQLLEMAMRTTIAVSIVNLSGDRRPGAYCLEGQRDQPLPPRVFAAVKSRIPIARAPHECTVAPTDNARRSELRTPDGQWAWRFMVQAQSESDTAASMDGSFHVGPLWAGGWRCRLVRESGRWRPTTCAMTWIS
jgi:hypothetical protein